MSMFASWTFAKYGVYMNRHVFAIIIVLSATDGTIAQNSVASSKAVVPQSVSDEQCLIYKTCAQCVERPHDCLWSFKRQACYDKSRGFDLSSSFGTPRAFFCPVFSVALDDRPGPSPYRRSIRVTIHRLRLDLGKFLNGSPVTCTVDGVTDAASMDWGTSADYDDNASDVAKNYAHYTIVCRGPKAAVADRQKAAPYAENPLDVHYLSVAVGDVRLRFDHETQHYVTAHRVHCDRQDCAQGAWRDGPTEYYCKWCADNPLCSVPRQQNRCVSRPLGDVGPPVAVNEGGLVEVKSPNVAIVWFRPHVAPSVGGMTLSLIVRNYRILASGRETVVIAGGRSCKNVTTTYNVNGGGDDKITCDVSRRTAEDESEGPVEVTYSSSAGRTDFVITSNEKVRFVRPTVTSVVPTCGSERGGDIVTVTGNFPDYEPRVTLAGERCKIREFNRTSIECVTGSRARPGDGPVVVEFGDPVLFATGPSPPERFAYAAPPVLDPVQPRFAGIASGGTRFSVRGRFVCVRNPRITYFAYADRDPLTEVCRTADDTAIVCPSPRLQPETGSGSNRTVDAASLPRSVPFRIGVEHCGRPAELAHTVLTYEPLPDPTFADFEADGAAVTVHGEFRYADYGANELRIRAAGTDRPCAVLLVDDRRVVCRFPDAATAGAVRRLEIEVGDRLTGTADLRTGSSHPGGSRPRVDRAGPRLPFAILLGSACVASALAALVCGVMFCYRIMQTNTRLRTDERYAEELRSLTSDGPVVDRDPKKRSRPIVAPKSAYTIT